jgi:hypothetical protein
MATGVEVLEMLLPLGGWIITGDTYEGIEFIDERPKCTQAEFEAGFTTFDAWQAAQDAKVQTPAEKLFNATGLTVAEYKALGL